MYCRGYVEILSIQNIWRRPWIQSYCLIWAFLIIGRVMNYGVFGGTNLVWKSKGAVQVLWLWSCILSSTNMSVKKTLSLPDTDFFPQSHIKSALAKAFRYMFIVDNIVFIPCCKYSSLYWFPSHYSNVTLIRIIYLILCSRPGWMRPWAAWCSEWHPCAQQGGWN